MRKLRTPAYGPEYRVEHWLNCKFSINRYFTALGFLSWMQENGFPIPDELAIDKDRDSKPFWAGSRQPIDYANLPKSEKIQLAWKWKQQGPDLKFNKEIVKLLWPGVKESNAIRNLNRYLQKYRP
jgi:hypothetical protein